MSASAGIASPPPGDLDLQQLYDQVWAGFVEETPTSENEAEKIYSVYGYPDENESSTSVADSSQRQSHFIHYTASFLHFTTLPQNKLHQIQRPNLLLLLPRAFGPSHDLYRDHLAHLALYLQLQR